MIMTKTQPSALLLVDSLVGGGAERAVLTIAEGLTARGWSITVVTLHPPESYPVPSGVSHVRLSDSGKTSNKQLASRLQKLYQTLCDDGQQPDLVVVNLIRSSEVARRVNFAGTPVYHALHNPLAEQIRRTRNVLSGKYIRHRMKALYHQQRIICMSAGIIDDAQNDLGITPLSAHVIYNPFDLDGIREAASRSEEPSQLARPFVLCVGHFKRQKRQDIALRAWATSGVDADIVFLGGGSEKKKKALLTLARQLQVSERVHILDWTENVYSWMAAAKLLIVSSDFEGFGRIIVEALAVGTPVVSTDCPSGPREILVGPLASGLAPVGDIDALAARIHQFYSTPPSIDPQSLQRFTLDSIIDQYESLPRD